jgi:ATP-dependent Clp protease ATP-binding subunit ClpA
MTPPPSLQDLINTVRQDTATDSALDQLITAAGAVAQLEDTSDALLGHFVDRCRREGRSWSEISAALGVSKQAVHKRFATSIADQIIAATPEPTLERLTPRARNVLAAAGLAARGSGQRPLSSVSILLGLFDEPEGIAATVLQAMEVSPRAVTSLVDTHSPAHQDEPADSQYTADGEQAVRDALAVAIELGHSYIGTEHLLLGLYRNAESPAAAILAAAGATEADVRTRVLELLRPLQQRGGAG